MTDPSLQNRYRECVRMLYSIAPSFQRVGVSGYHPGLECMTDFARFLGNPHKSLRTIHIAGTNGKGSVAHMLASAIAFRYPGSRVGLYTSPHLVDFRERIRVVSSGKGPDGRHYREIGQEDVVDFMSRCMNFIEERRPSFFEITTAMAFDYFARERVDIAVIETGLGGRLDSTNIIVPELSIITSIGLDHKDILGDTIEKIAREKAGIIKPGVPVVIGELPPEAEAVAAETASSCGSKLYRSGELCGEDADPQYIASRADLRSSCQVRNIRTVMTSLHILGAWDAASTEAVLYAIEHAAAVSGLRGRWERLSMNPEVICDIGHNVQALSETMRQLEAEAAGRHIIMVYGMAGDKDVEAVRGLLPLEAKYIFTQAQGSRAMPAGKLKDLVDASRRERGKADAGAVDSVAVESVEEAVDMAMREAGTSDIVFIGGSSYVVAEAMARFLQKSDVPLQNSIETK